MPCLLIQATHLKTHGGPNAVLANTKTFVFILLSIKRTPIVQTGVLSANINFRAIENRLLSTDGIFR